MKHHCACLVPVWLDLSALHPCLMHFLQLSFGPVQYLLSQLGPFLLLRDVKRGQVPINRRVSNPPPYSWSDVLATIHWPSRLFPGQWGLWSLGRFACLPSFVGVIIRVVIILAMLGTSAWATTGAARTTSTTASRTWSRAADTTRSSGAAAATATC